MRVAKPSWLDRWVRISIPDASKKPSPLGGERGIKNNCNIQNPNCKITIQNPKFKHLESK
jgi:hypothetical protein